MCSTLITFVFVLQLSNWLTKSCHGKLRQLVVEKTVCRTDMVIMTYKAIGSILEPISPNV